MDDSYSSCCSDCKTQTQIHYDHFSGDTICHDCGLVLEDHFIDQSSEWRTFASDDSAADDRDPSRIGRASNPLFSNNHLTTFTTTISSNSKAHVSSLKWGIHATSDPDATLIRGFETIATMCDMLDLVTTIKNRANVIYKKVVEDPDMKGRRNKDATLAACLYIACAQERKPRTLKEIESVANGVTQKEIVRAKKSIDKQYFKQQDMNMDAPTQTPSVEAGEGIHAADIIGRFCSHLNLKYQTIKAAKEAIKMSDQVDIRRNPPTVVAAVIYMITQLSPNDKRLLKDISAATGVAESTIWKACKDVYPYASRLIPCWYAQEEDLERLRRQ